MSTMQSLSASMASASGRDTHRLSELADAVPGTLADKTHTARVELTNIVRAGQSEPPSTLEEAASNSYEAVQDMRKTLQTAPQQVRNAAPVPRITIHAFCESHEVLSALERAAGDRLMSRATAEIFAGGIKAAVEYYQHNPAPNLIIVERRAPNDVVLAELEELALYCDPGIKVVAIGYSNDIGYYRELLQRGISEYLIAPVNPVSLISAISGIYRGSASGKLGKVYAFVGAKGGVGASTIAHNVGWTIARRFGSDVVLADLDLPFGTAGLNFNVDTHQGIAEALQDQSRLDEVLFDRLLTKCDDHFSLLTAPAALNASHDLHENALANFLEIAQANVPFTVLDIPHVWTSWARAALIAADEIIITAAPDLANLRNAKNLIEFLKQSRPHDGPPNLVLNQVGMAKRPEIKPGEFGKALQVQPIACIPFDAQLFGTAANNGKMISDTSSRSPAIQSFADVASALAGRKEPKKSGAKFFNLGMLLRQKRQKS